MKRIIKRLKKLLYILIGWILIIPLSLLIPKNKDSYIFIGRDNGKFLDNVKYLFLYYFNKINNNKEIKSISFLTEDKILYKKLKEKNFPMLLYPSLRAIWYSLRAKYLFVDNMMWINHYKWFLLFNTYKIQLWHGVAFKRIHLDETKYKNSGKRVKLILKLLGFNQKFDLIISTSKFYTNNLFKIAFKSRKIIETGYPRNDILLNPNKYNNLSLIETDINTINHVKKLKKEGLKIIVYTPTFRDIRKKSLKQISLPKLNSFAQKNDLAFIFKFHPDTILNDFNNYKNIIIYDKYKDIYPLLPLSDLLITDYSSIYTDYLLLNKPIIFFPFDFEEYIKIDRDFQFDYNWITPGPKAYNQNELEKIILETITEDLYKSKREKIKMTAFDYYDDKAADRIFDYLENIVN